MPVRRRRPRLGQHFLTDRRILERIVDALEPARSDVVLEIGAGRGTLTRVLAERVGRVVAIEKDARLASECGMRNAECGVQNVEIIAGDALALHWERIIPHSAFRTPHFKLAGNIPYQITTPLIEKALAPPLPQLIVFLMQTEVADRMAARPGSKVYGALSVGVQSVCRVETLFAVAATAFQPPPRVRSAVVRLRPLTAPLIEPALAGGFRVFVTACFSQRRKQLRNVLSAATGRPAAEVVAWLESLRIAHTQRPETLSPGQFVQVFRGSVAAADLRGGR